MTGAAIPWEQSYTGRLRALVGHRRLIVPGPRAIIRDAEGRILLVSRSDTGAWAMPAGQIEEGESIRDALVREVAEETGLIVEQAVPIALYTEDRFSFTTVFGDEHQMFAVVFLVTRWTGELTTTTEETRDAQFFARDELPELSPVYLETLADLDAFDGDLIVK